MKPEHLLIRNNKEIADKMAAIPKGPWSNECNYGEYGEEEIIFTIVRHPSKLYWTGFAGVKSGHPLYKDKGWSMDVHGGITMRGYRDDGITSDYDMPDDRVWWFGFSCNKATDFIPMAYYGAQNVGGKNTEGSENIEDYKNQDYVTEAARLLARHLLAALLGDRIPESML